MGELDDTEKPEWWTTNERLREEMELPPYTPPRFNDGTYTHQVISELGADYDCSIQFVGMNSTHVDDWQVRVDGNPVMSIGRRRDRDGNIIYEMSSDEFVSRLNQKLIQ